MERTRWGVRAPRDSRERLGNLPKQRVALADGTTVVVTVQRATRAWAVFDYIDTGVVRAKNAQRIVSRRVSIRASTLTGEKDGSWHEDPQYTTALPRRAARSGADAAWWDALVGTVARRRREGWWTPTELAWTVQSVDLDRLATSAYAGSAPPPGAAKLLRDLNLYEGARQRVAVASAIRSAALRLTKAGVLVRVQEPEAFGLATWVNE